MSGDWIGRPEWSGVHAVHASLDYLPTLELHEAAHDVRRLLDAWDFVQREHQRLWSFLQEAEGVRSSGSFLTNREHLLRKWKEASFRP